MFDTPTLSFNQAWSKNNDPGEDFLEVLDYERWCQTKEWVIDEAT